MSCKVSSNGIIAKTKIYRQQEDVTDIDSNSFGSDNLKMTTDFCDELQRRCGQYL